MSYCNLEHLSHQQTIAAPIVFVGIGLHSGQRTTMRLQPASANAGVTLLRRDLPLGEQRFAIHWCAVAHSALCTVIGNRHGHQVSTVEHLLSALAALGIDNVAIELDGPEVPIMDGSALPYVEALEKVGITRLDAPRDVIVIRRPVRLQQGHNWAELLPDEGRRITVQIDFDAQVIGTQTLSVDITPSTFRREIAPARTFGFAEDLEHLHRRGLALGGSIKNAILVRSGRVANMEGLRFPDEFVRHKVLDVIGDLSLAGAPIIGHYRGNRPGHQLNTDLVRLLMQDQDAWARLPVADLDRLVQDTGNRTAGKPVRVPAPIEAVARQASKRPAHFPLTRQIRKLFGNGSE
jgi:UDP-3-O-[3-hydroxymyristoyl] N-acetylglucosamine deacetylase